MPHAIGIDLGTTNCCVAAIRDGQPQVLTLDGGRRYLPSVFAMGGQGEALVGASAHDFGMSNPGQAIWGAKRNLGAGKATDQLFAYEMDDKDGHLAARLGGELFTFEDIATHLLRELREQASEVLGEQVHQAVITVPAYFTEQQRRAVGRAGKAAGLHVLRILNEPTAAALAYGVGRSLKQRVAVYDLGGGTFDVSIIDIRDQVYEVVATGGDTFLGGLSFDDRLVSHITHTIHERLGTDLSRDAAAQARLRVVAERCKIELSQEEHTDLPLHEVCEIQPGWPTHLPLTRAELERLTHDLVRRSIDIFGRVLIETGIPRADIDELLLVGGQSQMPLVHSAMEDFLGRPLQPQVQPQDAVAMGAAIMAQMEQQDDLAPPPAIRLQEVVNQRVGMALHGGRVHTLLPKGTPLPASVTQHIQPEQGSQANLQISLHVGDAFTVKACEPLVDFLVHGGELGLSEAALKIDMDEQGLISVTAWTLPEGRPLKLQQYVHRGKAAPPPLPILMPTHAHSHHGAPAPGSLASLRSAATMPPPEFVEQKKRDGSLWSRILGWFGR